MVRLDRYIGTSVFYAILAVLGIIVGAILHNQPSEREWLITNILSPAGDIFIHLIK